jgi:4-amino-4-deoxy-L-arabinose transferase-like glycosyltransferase
VRRRHALQSRAMTAVSNIEIPLMESRPPWRLDWLTPARCRIILTIVLLLDVVGHARYLNRNCPVDLSGDEAQYWDWSRNLDWSYYSKGPLVAYIIRASCAIFGDTMQGVRYPAIVFGVGTSIVTYLLTQKLFGSERLALGAVLLNHLVPMFVAGSVLMTIDPPMFFCWALATYFAATAIFDGKRWAWPLVGFAIGIGFLAKYAVMLWFAGLLVFFLLDPSQRKHLRTSGPWIALVISLLLTIPVIVWNAKHGWVSLRHVAHQTGASGGRFSRGNFFEFIGSQIAVVGPILAVMMIVATIRVFRRDQSGCVSDRQFFLASIGVVFFAVTLMASLLAKVQVNWPAPAYFTLMILTTQFLGTRLQSVESWRPWRGWFWGTVAFALLFTPIAHDSSLIFPAIQKTNAILGTKINPANVDVLGRLRGWKLLGDHLSTQLARIGPDAIVLCDDYMQTAEAAFYVAGQPVTYYAGSYYTDAKRYTQYDMWPDRRLDDPKLIGRNAIYVGKGGGLPKDIANAFNHLEPLPELAVIVRGVKVRSFKTWIGYGFKGMRRTDSGAKDF